MPFTLRRRDDKSKMEERERRLKERELEERERRLKERELEERERRLREREVELELREREVEEEEEKKGKIKVGGEYEFRAPEFDEKTFKFREMEEGKLLVILFAISIGIGLGVYYLWYAITGGDPHDLYGLLGFVPILVSMCLVYIVPLMLNLDLGHYTKFKWVQIYFYYFLMCLAFWIVFTDLLANPF